MDGGDDYEQTGAGVCKSHAEQVAKQWQAAEKSGHQAEEEEDEEHNGGQAETKEAEDDGYSYFADGQKTVSQMTPRERRLHELKLKLVRSFRCLL